MSPIRVLVVATSPDIKADVILASAAARPDMRVTGKRVLAVADVDSILNTIPSRESCAVIWVGGTFEPHGPARQWLSLRSNLVLLLVDVVGDLVRIGLRNPHLDSILAAAHALTERVGLTPDERVERLQFRSPEAAPEPNVAPSQPLLEASLKWVHSVLKGAVANFPVNSGDTPGYAVTRSSLLQAMDQASGVTVTDVDEAALDIAIEVHKAGTEHLGIMLRVLELGHDNFRTLLLALAPEMDLRYQRCFGYLLDNMGYRTGNIALHRALLARQVGSAADLQASQALMKWQVLESNLALHASGEPVRVDPFLAAWLLGDSHALASDPRLRRVLREQPWSGTELIDCVPAVNSQVTPRSSGPWTVLSGEDAAGWRFVVEAKAKAGARVIRVEPTYLAQVDRSDAEDCGARLARMAKLTRSWLVIDTSSDVLAQADGGVLGAFFSAISLRDCGAALICTDQTLAVRVLGQAPYEFVTDPPLTRAHRIAIVQSAAKGAGVYLSEDSAYAAATRFPLSVDAWERAMKLASRRPRDFDADDPTLERFLRACKEVATESVSNLAERVEPKFQLSDVVLPVDRKQQLAEIVDHVRLASKVLDDWKFRDQLPYGQGVAALFFGPSGTGKTMAAMAIARALGIQLLRVDLSRVVSKYIGDTEKNIDRIFADATRAGSALLIDEADALLGKRSEVKDAHDRYANIEIAFLLQRLEAYPGLSILTTNMKQNLDGAFLRRIRFIIDFPRPDADSREAIWRRCLPPTSHNLTDKDFRQLARRIDLTGGHIRQITLRAAFIAAAEGEKIELQQIAQATCAELAKLGLPPVELDLNRSTRAA